MALTFKRGKFYRDGIQEPLEFGNKDQIRIIENVKQLREEGAVPAYILDDTQKLFIGIRLRCVCGGDISAVWKTQDELNSLIGGKIKCTGCDFTYQICEDDFDFLFFKLVK